MADQQHLDLLKQGKDVWLQWRQHYPEVQPNLREVNLTGADLRDAYLYYTSLNWTKLKGG
jgi:uncharacterized protein YjbI with pentapeptide repeats